MAELAEEYSRLTRKILYWSIIVVAAIHVLLLVFDGFPWLATFFGLAMHLVYFQFLKDFPYVNFSSPLFIGACVGLLVNHYLWIDFFRDEYKFRVPQIMAFFVPCVWMVPFGFFVSVSLGDTVLPSATHSGGLTGNSDDLGGGKSSALKGLLSWFGNKRDKYMASSGFHAPRDFYGKDR
uniref:Protein TEX261 n=1 Tax=Cryptomonas curvata TaxID=233186 RepID=A0A7S0MYM0_9CRYP